MLWHLEYYNNSIGNYMCAQQWNEEISFMNIHVDDAEKISYYEK